ncbi:MAG: Crp/Fnr family transcriptional regulator [Bacteroidales bacterium]|nr:Crp/Fnr family transcriptional regulator [Bacteroidales bacterium]MBN2698218.1 Crp/Fnr family transcriptional regulator [Bacteroidales bacterium]
MEELVKKRFPFFESALREAISKNGIVKTFHTGEELIREDQFIRAFPIVLKGLIKVCRTDQEGNELLLYYLKPGEVCTVSLTCCMDRTRSRVKAIAEEPSEAILLTVELIDSWITQYQTWKEFVMHAMKMRFDELLNTLDSIAFMKMDDRLVRFFSDRFKTTGLKIYKGSHQDIALSLNTSREVISRLLKEMERKKMIRISRNRIDYSMLCD